MIKLKEFIRVNFIAGLLFLAPLFITFYIIRGIIEAADENLIPANYYFPGVGVFVAILLILLTGFLGRNVLGRFLFSSTGELLKRIPVIGAIYSSTRQLFETFIGDKTKSFGGVVLVQYPHPDSWALGFVVSENLPADFLREFSDPMVTVFVPTSPNPTSGFILYFEKTKVKKTKMKVDEAFKIILSIGAGGAAGAGVENPKGLI